MSRAATRAPDASPRQALVRGAGALILGLAIVGTGHPAEGGPVALAGLLLTIYGIHRFGRLGPDDLEPESPELAAATDATFGGLAALVAGGAFVAGSKGSTAAYLVMGVGAIALGWGQRERGRVAAKAAKDERRAAKTAGAKRAGDELDDAPDPIEEPFDPSGPPKRLPRTAKRRRRTK
jgi:hypothetical protein